MDFSSEQLFQFFAQTGSLIRFEPGTIFGNTNAHIGVVVNSDPNTQRAVVVVCASSQLDKARSFAVRRNLHPGTVVSISGGTHAHFGQNTAFLCNTPESVSYDVLASWHGEGNIRLIRRNNQIDTTLLNEIRAGIIASDMVEDTIKDMLV